MSLPPDPNVVITPLTGDEVVNIQGGGELSNKFTTTQSIRERIARALGEWHEEGHWVLMSDRCQEHLLDMADAVLAAIEEPDEAMIEAGPTGATGVTGATGSGTAPVGTSALIASAIGVDLNTTGDTTMTLSAFATGKYFVVDYTIITNCGVNLDTAVVGVFSGAGGTGQIYAGSGNPGGLTGNLRDWTNEGGENSALSGFIGTMQNTAPIVNVSTPQGAAATADFYVYGRVFS